MDQSVIIEKRVVHVATLPRSTRRSKTCSLLFNNRWSISNKNWRTFLLDETLFD
jgi:hypothetical protein